MDYFKHDLNASEDDKICNLLANGGYESLGYYWRFIEYLYNRGGKVDKKNLLGVAWHLHMDADKLSAVISDYDLFKEEDGFIYSTRVCNEINEFSSLGKRMSELGKAGGKASAKAKAEQKDNESESEAVNKADAQAEVNRTLNRTLSVCLTDSQPCAQAEVKRESSVGSTKEKKENKINKNKIKESKERKEDATPTIEKSVFGKFKNVFLTQNELSLLKSDYPRHYLAKIERLSEYMHQTGKSYIDHYSILVTWINQDKEKKKDDDGFLQNFFDVALTKTYADSDKKEAEP